MIVQNSRKSQSQDTGGGTNATGQSLDGTLVTSAHGRPFELACEPGVDGVVRYPCLPTGAEVRLTGIDSTGARIERQVRVSTSGWVPVMWE